MIAGIVPHPTQTPSAFPRVPRNTGNKLPLTPTSPALTSLLILAYSPPDKSFFNGNEMTDDRAEQARKQADRPELQIISRTGEELAADALSLTDFQFWGCNDYVLAEVGGDDVVGVGEEAGRCYVVLSPRDVVIVKPRDRRDHVTWLVERKRYEEALKEIERIDASGGTLEGVEDGAVSASEIGRRYIEHLVHEG
jgi:hypothetical protein